MFGREFRQYLKFTPLERLFDYARHCLESSFDKSGLVLQDIVSEFGRPLDFEVESGLYQGKRNAVGFDGIWHAKGEPDLIIEVKTTDYITVSLEKLAVYREKLLADGKVGKNASILIVVGREDTGALEAQIRGSRYAWDMRLISIERLIKLVQIREKSDDLSTVNQIRQLLQPFEYTKIDKIIDVIFTTTVNVESQQEIEHQAPTPADADGEEHEGGKQIKTARNCWTPNGNRPSMRLQFLKARNWYDGVRRCSGLPIKNFVCAVPSPKDTRAIINLTGVLTTPNGTSSWPRGRIATSSSPAWTGMKPSPCRIRGFRRIRKLNMTDTGDRLYWHVAITTLEGSKLAINTSKAASKTALEPYGYALKSIDSV